MINFKGLVNRIFFRKKTVHVPGVIERSVFAYLSPKLLILTLFAIIFTYSVYDTLLVYFKTNVPLNGLIISLIIFAVVGVFFNKWTLYSTGQFLLRVETFIDNDDVTEEDIEELKQALTRQGKLLNTRNMNDALTNISLYQHPNFTEADARVIQSKLGNRINFRHASVGFIAGVLVMLGLLGTFMGLLKTIDAVGQALNSMANMGADGGELGMEQMSEFIGSLAKPLQGMGLAFSSSLFGLSGSLLISVLNKFGMDVHDGFIENVSRWIDNRILKAKGGMSTPGGSGLAMGGVEHNDLESWLAGFIYLSNKTNKRLSKLSLLLYKTHEEQAGISDVCNEIANTQKDSSKSLEDIATNMQEVKDNSDFVKNTISDIASRVENVQEQQFNSLKLQEDNATINNEMSAVVQSNSTQLMNLSETTEASRKVNDESANTLQIHTKHLKGLVEDSKNSAEIRRDMYETIMINSQQLKGLIEIVEESTEFSYEHKKLFVDVVNRASNKQIANLDKNTELLSSLLADMVEDINDKVEGNVASFMKEKHKIDNVEDSIKKIIDSQNGLEKEMAALIREMSVRGDIINKDSSGDNNKKRKSKKWWQLYK